MKKAISLILALLMCLSLCACGGQKYVGVYKGEDLTQTLPSDRFSFCKELTLTAGGSGTYKKVVTKGGKSTTEGMIAEEGQVSWSVSDRYLVVTIIGTNYVNANNGFYFTMDGKSNINTSYTFELKGNLLMDISNGAGFKAYTKIK